MQYHVISTYSSIYILDIGKIDDPFKNKKKNRASGLIEKIRQRCRAGRRLLSGASSPFRVSHCHGDSWILDDIGVILFDISMPVELHVLVLRA